MKVYLALGLPGAGKSKYLSSEFWGNSYSASKLIDEYKLSDKSLKEALKEIKNERKYINRVLCKQEIKSLFVDLLIKNISELNSLMNTIESEFKVDEYEIFLFERNIEASVVNIEMRVKEGFHDVSRKLLLDINDNWEFSTNMKLNTKAEVHIENVESFVVDKNMKYLSNHDFTVDIDENKDEGPFIYGDSWITDSSSRDWQGDDSWSYNDDDVDPGFTQLESILKRLAPNISNEQIEYVRDNLASTESSYEGDGWYVDYTYNAHRIHVETTIEYLRTQGILRERDITTELRKGV